MISRVAGGGHMTDVNTKVESDCCYKTMDCLKVTVIAVLLSFLNHSVAGDCTDLEECQECLDYRKSTCFWCESTEKCMKKSGLVPKGCKSLNWRYHGNCNVPGYVWVIVIPVLCILFLVSLTCCFYCFCCRCKTSSRSLHKEEEKFERKRLEIKEKHEERRAERKLKNDEIRKKYGLYKEDGASTSNKYEQYEDDKSLV